MEIDEKCIVNREIGLDKNNKPLFTAPNSRNTGYWTGSSRTFTTTELQLVEKEYFEKSWQTTNESA